MFDKVPKLGLKISKALREGGGMLLLRRSGKFVFQRSRRLYNELFYVPPVHVAYRDVLFINGCTLQHPSRYRVDHQIEQLSYFGMSSEQIFREFLGWRHLHLYRTFVFFRCPSNEFIEEFASEAKKRGKKLFFDIDDLIYDTNYVKSIDYVKQLKGQYRDKYIMGDMLDLCDYGVTTTRELSASMLERMPEVLINRNVASSEMVDLCEAAFSSNRDSKFNSPKIRIGYLSGSITHNPDLALIEHALVKVAKANSNVVIVLVGLVSPSNLLFSLGSQLELLEFSDWKTLPETLSKLDINIAPLENTRFNRAKSENKWLEAALVRVPTVASDVGSFNEVVEHGVDGYLCSNINDWESVLFSLTSDRDLIARIGANAYSHVSRKYGTQKSGGTLVRFIQERIKPLYVFVVPTLTLSGGMRVILQHASIIKRSGMDVLIYVDSDDEVQEIEYDGETFSVIGTREILLEARIDTLVATLWTTVARVVAQIKVRRRVYLVQNYEVDFYLSDRLNDKVNASITYLLEGNVEYLTISRWCQSWLEDLYNVNAAYLPNGIDISNFEPRQTNVPFSSQIINVLIEGNSDDEYKNVDESMKIVLRLKEMLGERLKCHLLSYRAPPKNWYPVDDVHFEVPFDQVSSVYEQCDVLIKSSKVESFSYPPLEMMATGGLVILGRNPGNAEYANHGENCMCYDIGDVNAAVSEFNQLMNNENLRTSLVRGGKATATDRDWKNIEPQIKDFWV